MKIRNITARLSVALMLAMVSVASFAQDAGGADYSQITGAVSWGSVAAGITGILAALVLPKVALKGGRMLLSAIR